jgi:hypothetical protein
VVVSEEPLTVEVDGERRPAWVDTLLLGEMREGDEVVVNVAALDLGLGSGGFDVVHVNLTRGLDAAPGGDEHVMKLNYTSLQHPVRPVEAAVGEPKATFPVAVLPLHGHLAPAAWGAIQAAPGVRVGYVQTGGGALPGSLSRDVVELRERAFICDHITAGPAYGGEHEALSTIGALDAGRRLRWDAALVGPGPGIIGSDTEFGHGGTIALDNAHAALALGMPTVVSPRLSSSDPRERHLHLSHHTRTLLERLLAPVEVAMPDDEDWPGAAQAYEQLSAAAGPHDLRRARIHIEDYAESGLPARTMGRSLGEDPLFFAAGLAAGTRIGELVLAG